MGRLRLRAKPPQTLKMAGSGDACAPLRWEYRRLVTAAIGSMEAHADKLLATMP
jgi:hypothetical protein